MHKTVGILGGMGPLASVDLFDKITRITQAERDREHLHVVVESNPLIPDRIGAILSGTESPVPEMVRSALRLEAAGCDLMVMACNTAHYFYDDVKKFVHIPFLHMPNETVAELKRQKVGCAGVLGTTALIQAKVYNRPFEEAGLALRYPEQPVQEHLMHLIFDGVKAGRTDIDLGPLPDMLRQMQAQGVEVFVLACTELPFLFARPELAEFKVLDPTLVLAKAAVRAAGATARESL